MKISKRIADVDFGLQIGGDIRREDADALRAQLARLLALVDAAHACVADYEDAQNEKYDENKWAEFSGTDSVAAALAALREHGDI